MRKLYAAALMAFPLVSISAPIIEDAEVVTIPEYAIGKCQVTVPPVISPSSDPNCNGGWYRKGRRVYNCTIDVFVDCDFKNMVD